MEKTEGVTLKAVPYKDGEKILSVFSKENGLATFIIKKLSLKKPELLNGANLFCLSEFVYLKGQREIYFLKDLTLLNSHLFLREDLSYIEQAALMARALCDSQLPNKKAPELYELFKKYLLKIPEFKNELTLAYSFILKLLLHEGLLHLTGSCSRCPKQTASLFQGEPLCQDHAPAYALNFIPEEIELLKILAYSRSFSELKNLTFPVFFKEKIWRIFQEVI
jgi:DNA repair protein RecO (recombination protein O)